MTEPVTTGQIYWGAVPFVVIQCIMVGLVIAFPAMVMHYKTVGPQVDTKRELVLPPMDLPWSPSRPVAANRSATHDTSTRRTTPSPFRPPSDRPSS